METILIGFGFGFGFLLVLFTFVTIPFLLYLLILKTETPKRKHFKKYLKKLEKKGKFEEACQVRDIIDSLKRSEKHPLLKHYRLKKQNKIRLKESGKLSIKAKYKLIKR